MRFDTGIHPSHWHRRSWLLAIVLAVLALVLSHRASGGIAYAMEPPPEIPPTAGAPAQPEPSGDVPATPEAAPLPEPVLKPASDNSAYIAEIIDSSYTVGPAEFLAIDLPTTAPGAKAVHLFGTVTAGRGKDIVVRLFRASDYDRWLKVTSGRKPDALWTSPRSRSLTLDHDLPPGEPMVLLLDNGYSIRTPKKVTCQLQLRYARTTETFDTEGSGKIAGSTPGGSAPEVPDNLPTPRANTEQELPPPPPPPPPGY